jgi:hypothetical protein
MEMMSMKGAFLGAGFATGFLGEPFFMRSLGFGHECCPNFMRSLQMYPGYGGGCFGPQFGTGFGSPREQMIRQLRGERRQINDTRHELHELRNHTDSRMMRETIDDYDRYLGHFKDRIDDRIDELKRR